MFNRKSRTDKAATLADQVVGAARPYAERAKPYVDAARPYVERIGQAAQEKGAPLVEHARGFAHDTANDLVPHIEHARDVFKDDVAPKVTGAVSDALTASAPYREEAARRGSAALAALKGEVQVSKPKRRWARKLAVVAGIAGLVALAYKYLTGESSTSGWQTPTPPAPTPSPGTTGPATADPAYTSDPGTGNADADEAAAQAEAPPADAGEAAEADADPSGDAPAGDKRADGSEPA